MVRSGAVFLLVALLFPTAQVFAQSTAGQTRVLRGIPAIAQTFAPIGGVKWQEFAQVLAGICAVESLCSPTYLHYTKDGVYSQYQGLFQMSTKSNNNQVALAERDLEKMLPRIQQMAQSGQIPVDAYEFVQKAIQAGRSMPPNDDKRFHPEYGMVLGAIKHIQINPQLAKEYAGKPLHQAAGHMTAQFSGSVMEKIRRGAFDAPISSAEAWALGQNKVAGVTVRDAIESAGAQHGKKMDGMMRKMAQVTNDMSLVPTAVEPFNAPPFREGGGSGYPGVSNSPISQLLESGFISPNDPRVQANFPTASQGATSGTNASPSQTSSGSSELNNGTQQGAGPFAATLVTQRTFAEPGETVLIAWSSVGMKANSCSLGIQGGTAFVQGANEGDQSFKLPDGAVSGSTLVLQLSCTTLGGENVVRGASIGVE